VCLCIVHTPLHTSYPAPGLPVPIANTQRCHRHCAVEGGTETEAVPVSLCFTEPTHKGAPFQGKEGSEDVCDYMPLPEVQFGRSSVPDTAPSKPPRFFGLIDPWT